MDNDRSVLSALLVYVLATGLLLASLPGTPTVGTVPEEDIFTWFDGLGFPDLSKAKYVEVATGQWSEFSDKAPQNEFIRGFLVKDDGNAFEVFTTDLFICDFTKTDPGTPEHERVGYKRIDLSKEMDVFLRDFEKPSSDGFRFRRCEPCIDEEVQVLVLGRACAAQGHADQAAKLLAKVKKQCEGRQGRRRAESVKQCLSDKIASSLLSRAGTAFSDPAVSRKELLARFENLVKKYPDKKRKASEDDVGVSGWDAEAAREYLAVLRRMVAEDEAEAKRAKPDRPPTKREQIAELIFHLREQKYQGFPPFCDIFGDFGFGGGNKNTPAHQLVDFGYDAVPQLIDALEDRRLTRAVSSSRHSSYPYHVLRVGDCAAAILERIADRSFESRPHMSAQKATETKMRVQAWWAELQKKGEKQMLVEGIQLGGEDGIRQASRLAKRYPDVALDAISKAARQEKVGNNRPRLVEIAATLPGEKVLAFLRDEAKNGPILDASMAAARALFERGDDNGLTYAIAAWENTVDDDGLTSADAAISFLANCNRVEGLAALGKDLRKRPPSVRVDVMRHLSWAEHDPQKARLDVINAARDRILVEALHDVERRSRWSFGTPDGKSFADPRVCDMAGHMLSRAWGLPDAFDLSGTLRTRNRQRVELENTWRRKQGLKPLPLPEVRRCQPLPENEFNPSLRTVLEARTPGEQRRAIAALEKLGPGALPPLRNWLATKGTDHPAREALQKAVFRIAFAVDEIVLAEKSVPPDKALQQRIDSLKGKPLEAEAIRSLLVAAARSLPEGSRGIEIGVEREGDDTGVTLTLGLVPGNAKSAKDATSWWSTYESITVNRQGTFCAEGSSSREHGMSETAWQGFTTALARALAAPPEQSMSAWVRIAHP
jgi:hypothetical protein